MTRSERFAGMVSLALANGLMLGGAVDAAHRGGWWSAAIAVVVATVFAYAATRSVCCADHRAWHAAGEARREFWRARREARRELWREQRARRAGFVAPSSRAAGM